MEWINMNFNTFSIAYYVAWSAHGIRLVFMSVRLFMNCYRLLFMFMFTFSHYKNKMFTT